jgi:hypothetical protein
MGDAQPQQKPAAEQLGQGMLALLRGRGIAGVDVGDAASDNQGLRLGHQETAQGKGFIAQHLRIPQRPIAESFGVLRQLGQLCRRERISKAKHPQLAQVHGPTSQRIDGCLRMATSRPFEAVEAVCLQHHSRTMAGWGKNFTITARGQPRPDHRGQAFGSRPGVLCRGNCHIPRHKHSPPVSSLS